MDDSEGEEDMLAFLNTIEQADLSQMANDIEVPQNPVKLLFSDDVHHRITQDIEHHFDRHNLEMSEMLKRTNGILEKIMKRKDDLKKHLEYLWNSMAFCF